MKADRRLRRLLLAVVWAVWMCLGLSVWKQASDRGRASHIDPTAMALDEFVAGAKTRPRFILHVGPPKTATTTIQCGLEEHSGLLAVEDSTYFVGKRCQDFVLKGGNETMANGESQIEGHHLMMGLINGNENSRGIEHLKSRMGYHLQRKNHMVFSLESMSPRLQDRPEVWSIFGNLFEGWDLQIVVSYRRYFDWIRSMYFQAHVGFKYQRWPHEKNGLPHPSFLSYLEYHLARFETGDVVADDFRAFGQHLSLSAYRKFARQFDNVRVFDLHQREREGDADWGEVDIFADFLCQMLPARATCRRLSKQRRHLRISGGTIDESRNASNGSIAGNARIGSARRVSRSFDAERLAMAAYDGGLVDGKSISKKELATRTSKRLEETRIQIEPRYLSCLPKSLEERFLNASLAFERDLAAEIRRNHDASGEDGTGGFEWNETLHTILFERAVRSGKFCEIDPDKVLKNESWVEFFSRNN